MIIWLIHTLSLPEMLFLFCCPLHAVTFNEIWLLPESCSTGSRYSSEIFLYQSIFRSTDNELFMFCITHIYTLYRIYSVVPELTGLT